MTSFLPAAIINDTLNDICEKIAELRQYIKAEDTEAFGKGLDEIEDMALNLWVFIERFPCQPLIYTGQGTTEEIIKRLEWALAFSEGIDPTEYFNYIEKKKTAR